MDIYKLRREILLSRLESDAIVILIGNTEKVRNRDIRYLFRQDHDFFYLTGFEEPNAIAVLRPNSDAPFILFNQPKDPYQETWFAKRAGQEGAIKDYGADDAFDIAEFDKRIRDLIGYRKQIYFADEFGLYRDKVLDWMSAQRKSVKFDQRKSYPSLHSILPKIHNQRVVKDEIEIRKLRKAAEASVAGHQHLMSLCQPGISEQQMAAEFFNVISQYGCQDVGYPTILAGGDNACCLHYDINREVLKDGELVLVDAGGDYQYYTADITRTYPVNGKFNSEQKALYNIVLAALDAAIAEVKPGVSWNKMYPAAIRVLCAGLIDLGIIKGPLERALKEESYLPFTLHKTGHWLGMDVHDVGSYRQLDTNGDEQDAWTELQPNMVFTLEPGLYFPLGMEEVEPKWQGIGIRIEDDILVTQNGYENLTAGVPRTVAEIEEFMASGMISFSY